MVDLEIALVNRFGWSLRDIDETDVESLLPFILKVNQTENGSESINSKLMFCDQGDFL